MATTYNKRYGVDWPKEFSDLFIDMTIAKKWKLFRDQGIIVSVDPGECMVKAVKGLFPDDVKFSPWTQTMVEDFAREDKYAMIGCGSCGKSYAMAACCIAYWLTDPLNTAVIVGSATLKDLQTRSWSPILTLFSTLKNNKAGIPIPGKIVSNQYAIVNEKDESMSLTMSAKAAIQGRALDEGRIIGTHADWVLLAVDELGLVRDIESLKTAITNISIGTRGFKCLSAANPDPWDSPNSCFYIPAKGDKVTVDTGSWRSQMGYFVRHFDGLKSPVVLDPKTKLDFPFLMSGDDVKSALDLCNGDDTNPRFWKMVRGFPLSSFGNQPTVLDPLVAAANRVAQPLEEPMNGSRSRVGLAAGVDPAWSDTGDDAIFAGCEVVQQDGRPILDFTGRHHKMALSVSSKEPITQQLRDGVITRLNTDGGPKLHCVYIDSSGNQGLADALDIYVGGGCGHINSSERASEFPLRALDATPARKRVRDRGTESWFVLAEFCRAGMVRGLPQDAVDGLIQRRYLTKTNSTSGSTNEPITPLRLESKDDFIKRFKGSPNKTDACALAALAVKERLGIVPYGSVPPPVLEGTLPGLYVEHGGTPSPIPDREYHEGDFADIEMFAGD